MASAQLLTDHDRIREWAEERGARPARVKGTGGKNDPGMIRLDFPGYSGEDSLEPISWSEWFRAFDENNLALLVQERTSRGQKSNFNKLVSRETARARVGSRSDAASAREKGRGRKKAAAPRKRAASARTRKTAGRKTATRSAGRKTAGKSAGRKTASKTARTRRSSTLRKS
jgi:hypothetical protein